MAAGEDGRRHRRRPPRQCAHSPEWERAAVKRPDSGARVAHSNSTSDPGGWRHICSCAPLTQDHARAVVVGVCTGGRPR